METGDSSPPGWWGVARRLGARLLGVVHNRLELLLVELQEERCRWFNALLLAALVLGLGLLTLVTAAAVLIIVLWEEYRVAGLAAAAGAFLLATIVCYWRLRAQLRNWPFLSATLNELKKDRACLERKD